MKLSVNIICSELSALLPNVTLYKKTRDDNQLTLSCPRYETEPAALCQNQIYITSPYRLPSAAAEEGPCLLILTETPGNVRFQKQLSVIVAEGAERVDLFNRVLAIFDKYRDWEDALQELVFQNAPIEEYLKRSFPFLGNSMSVHNNNFNYLARFGGPARPEDGREETRQNFFDPDFLLRVDEQSSQSVFYSREIIRYRDEGTRQEYFFLNLFNGNTAAGRLVVVSDRRPFAPQDGDLIRHLGKYLETALSYAMFTGFGKNLRRDALLDYLSGKRHSDDKIMHLKTVSPFSRLKEEQRLYCLAGVCHNSELPEQYIAFQLERALPESVSVLYDSRLIVLCANRPKQTAAELFGELDALLRRYDVTAGCSNPFTDFYDLRYCYRQAEFTLRQVEDRPDGGTLHHFRDHTLAHFMQYGASVLPPRLLCADCVLRLAEHDKTASVSYCDSLRVYLDTGMNATETARRLDITRNTFLARLERILRYVDVDLEDLDRRFFVQLSLHLLRQHGTDTRAFP